MPNFGRVATVLGLILSWGTAGAAITVTLDVIVSGSTAIPGGTGTFRYLSEPSIEDGIIAFVGSNDAFDTGVYLWKSGNLQAVADDTDPGPGSSSNFAAFGFPVVANGAVLFPASVAGTAQFSGVYRFSGGSLTTVVDSSAALPGLAEILPLSHVAARGSGLFVQSVSDFKGYVVRLTPGPAGAIAFYGDPAPGGGTFGTFRRASTDGTEVSFITGLQGTSTNVLIVSDAGALSAIAAPGTPLPNGQLEALTPNRIHSHGGGEVAFIGKPVGLPDSLYVWKNWQIRLVVEGTETPSGGGAFEDLASVAVSEDGDLAFVGYAGLYVQSGDQRQEVLNTATQLNGHRVSGIYLGPSGISNNVVTVKVLLDGNEELIVRIPYTVSQASAGGGGGGGVDPWTLMLLAAVFRKSLRRTRAPSPPDFTCNPGPTPDRTVFSGMSNSTPP
ncbi:MAG: hypothetical protein IT368_11175 [Candidatus Hydrogenedentes bacterium]|nr:hypothetical protein [Candidatus Hydrogenedentota bacterium]